MEALRVRLFVPDIDQNRIAYDWTHRLNRASAYDNFYLALAQALEGGLWTAEKRLFNALRDAGLKWLPWIEELTVLNND